MSPGQLILEKQHQRENDGKTRSTTSARKKKKTRINRDTNSSTMALAYGRRTTRKSGEDKRTHQYQLAMQSGKIWSDKSPLEVGLLPGQMVSSTEICGNGSPPNKGWGKHSSEQVVTCDWRASPCVKRQAVKAGKAGDCAE